MVGLRRSVVRTTPAEYQWRLIWRASVKPEILVRQRKENVGTQGAPRSTALSTCLPTQTNKLNALSTSEASARSKRNVRLSPLPALVCEGGRSIQPDIRRRHLVCRTADVKHGVLVCQISGCASRCINRGGRESWKQLSDGTLCVFLGGRAVAPRQ